MSCSRQHPSEWLPGYVDDDLDELVGVHKSVAQAGIRFALCGDPDAEGLLEHAFPVTAPFGGPRVDPTLVAA